MKGKKRKDGGRTDMKVAGNPDVFKEAEGKEEYSRKKGGRAHHKRKAGGAVKEVAHKMTGGAVRPRLDRPGRKRGGGVGADLSPLSSAHHTSSAHEMPKEQGGN
jgi:hypothetical protein